MGSTVLTNTGLSDLFLAKYDGSGNVLWAKSATGSSYDYGWGLDTDSKQTFTYPNPALDFLTVDYAGDDEPVIEITDMNGQVMYVKAWDKNRGINISAYPTGVYVIKVMEKEAVKIEKMIKF